MQFHISPSVNHSLMLCKTNRCFNFNLGAAGALTAMIIKRLGFAEKYWSLLFTINGGLTGMVSQTLGYSQSPTIEMYIC